MSVYVADGDYTRHEINGHTVRTYREGDALIVELPTTLPPADRHAAIVEVLRAA